MKKGLKSCGKKEGGLFRFQNGKMVRWSIPNRVIVPQHPSWRSLQLPTQGRVRHSVTRTCPPSTTQSTGLGHGRPPHPRPRAIPEVSTSTPSCPCLGYRWPLHHPAARSSLNQALYTCSTSLLQPIWDLSGLLTPKRGHYRIRECTSLSFKNNSPELIYSPNVIFELI